MLLVLAGARGKARGEDVPIHAWDEGIAKMAAEKKPGIAYFGGQESTFILYALSEKTRQWLAQEKAVLIRVGMGDCVSYPLGGLKKTGEQLADFFGLAAGAILVLNRELEPLSHLCVNRIVHDCDSELIEDIYAFLIEGRDYRKTSMLDYAVLTDHRSAWQGFVLRLAQMRLGPEEIGPKRSDLKKNVMHRYLEDGQQKSLGELENQLVIVTEIIDRITIIQVKEIVRQTEDKLPITVISRKDQKGVFDELLPFKSVSFKELADEKRLFEFPWTMYFDETMCYQVRGYWPMGLFALRFSMLKELTKTQFDPIDPDLPFGEYYRVNYLK
ncbi:MAG: hypothetical protein HQL31_02510 [Planctomycetes bacterium]|nr:hypothetical protein [Planctomycetota bacterium]